VVCSPLSVLVESERNRAVVCITGRLLLLPSCAMRLTNSQRLGFTYGKERERKNKIKGGSLGLRGKWLAVWFPSSIGTGADMWIHPPYWMNASPCVGGWSSSAASQLVTFLFHFKKEREYNSFLNWFGSLREKPSNTDPHFSPLKQVNTN